jgi:hypothetical protein
MFALLHASFDTPALRQDAQLQHRVATKVCDRRAGTNPTT